MESFFKIVCYVTDNKEREQECVGIDMEYKTVL